ncbi:GMC oxidoreductase [Marinomonas sp.]|uniref:GMC oxidoreductase n=1 Tax=Marinomonas sp. TaxID=1904862 RepID=UPI003BA8B53F
MTNSEYDAIVIGGGATGTFAVDELTQKGLKVLLLEAGPAVKEADFKAPSNPKKRPDINIMERAIATIKGQPIQSRAAFFSNQFSHLYVKDSEHPYTTPKDAPYLYIRGKQLGGRLHTFGRVLLRWTDDDFKIHSKHGIGVDWPLSYAELAPFYSEVEQKVGLLGTQDNVAQLPDGEYAAPSEFTQAEKEFKACLEVVSPTRHVVPWRYMLPQREEVANPLKAAKATGLLEVKTNAIVRKVIMNEAGDRAVGVEVIDRVSKAVSTLNAKLIVLSASPVESIRLLLNSKHTRHPNGLGNDYGNLGKYFMDQVPCIAMGSFAKSKGSGLNELEPIDDFYGHSGGIFIPRFDKHDELYGDYNFQGTVGRNDVASNLPSRLSFFGFGRMLPDANNAVSLDKKLDQWGVPIPHIRCVMGEADKQLLQRQEKAVVECVESVGGELEFVGSPLGLTEKGKGAYPNESSISRLLFRKLFKKIMLMGAAIHETGGVRMGEEPTTSVLNPYNQVWNVPNVLVTDASCFPGSGIAGTTLTGMAITVRACRHAADLIRRDEL